MEEYKSKDLDHLGIVAVMCEEIGLVQLIDTLIPSDPRSNLTTGECVKLMVINGLRFTSRPLYRALFTSSVSFRSTANSPIYRVFLVGNRLRLFPSRKTRYLTILV